MKVILLVIVQIWNQAKLIKMKVMMILIKNHLQI